MVARRVAAPLGSTGLRWSPVDVVDPVDVAPTEPGTPTGQVHDELVAATARPVGNAGLFGALVEPDDVARRAGSTWGQALGLRRGDPGFMV